MGVGAQSGQVTKPRMPAGVDGAEVPIRPPAKKRPDARVGSLVSRAQRAFNSVLKVADAGEHHRHTALIGGGDHLGIAHTATGLDGGGCTSFGGGNQAVGKRE